MEGVCCYFSGGSSCAASRAGGGGDGVQAAAWPGRTVCKATHDDHTAWAVQTPPAPLCMIDLETCIFKARCWMLSSLSDCCSVSVVCHAGQAYSVSDLTTAVNTLSMLWRCIPARLSRVRKYNRWAALLCTTSAGSPHVKFVQVGVFSIQVQVTIGPAVRADFRRLYPANAKTPTCCPSDDNRTKVTNSVTSARSLWWHVGPYFWPADLTRTANPTGHMHACRCKSFTNNYKE